MRVAMIGQKGLPAAYGGVERHVEELSTRLAKRGIEVTVYNRRWFSDYQKKTFQGIRVVTTPTLHTKHFDTITHTLTSTIHALITHHDIIHFHGVGPSLLSWIPRIFSPHTVVITTFHCIDRKHKKWGGFARIMLRLGEWSTCRFAHKIIAVSKTIAAYALAVYDCTAIYIPNGINPVKPITNSEQIIQNQFGLTHNNYVAVVTRLIPHKGIHHLITAFTGLNTKKKLVIVGGGHFTDLYVKRLHELTHGDKRIIFTGFQSGAALHALYEHAALVVQPSELEGLSISLLEAMNYGRPLLASDIDENREALSDYGWYFKSGNSADLARQLKKLLATPRITLERRAKIGQVYVNNLFNWDTITSDTLHLYEKLVAVKPGKKRRAVAAAFRLAK
ncbi:MAG TPA: glycosyl transferase family 1 [Candidatus Magasanikbacteria bacterium]|nr:glycosyl transferase family 1 [Candidatus Magasanikbacteria bacterium]